MGCIIQGTEQNTVLSILAKGRISHWKKIKRRKIIENFRKLLETKFLEVIQDNFYLGGRIFQATGAWLWRQQDLLKTEIKRKKSSRRAGMRER